MVRTSSKSEKQSAASTASSVAPVATVPVSSPVLENVVVEKAAPKRTKKAKVEPVAVVAVAPVATETVVAVAPVESTESPVSVKMAEFSAKLQQLNSLFSSFKSEFKVLEKSIQKEMRAAQKSSSKKAKRSGNRQPSGFVKPTRISDELAKFLGKESGVEMARTSVSKEINQYIRTNSLQDKANGRKINPDASLSTLLKIQPGDELTYFNLQKFMKGHFVKASDSVAVAAVAV